METEALIASIAADYVRFKRDAIRLRAERVITYCHRAEPNNGQGEYDADFNPVTPSQSKPCWKGYDYSGEDPVLVVKKENWCDGCKYRQQIHDMYRLANKQRGIAERRLMHFAKKLSAVPELVLPPRPAAPVQELAPAPVLAAVGGSAWETEDDFPF